VRKKKKEVGVLNLVKYVIPFPDLSDVKAEVIFVEVLVNIGQKMA